jgi:hypothetical protein
MVISVITHSWFWSISDGRGSVESAHVAVIVQHPINHFPEAQDQDVALNENRPIKIKLEAKDSDDKVKIHTDITTIPRQDSLILGTGGHFTICLGPKLCWQRQLRI